MWPNYFIEIFLITAHWIPNIFQTVTLISIAAKIYNAPLFNRIEPEIEKILWNNQMAFGETDPQHRRL